MQTIQNNQTLGELIRKERKHQQLTQAQLSALSGVGIRFISELENGKESCRIGLAIQVIHTLGLSLAVYGRGEQPS